MMLVKNATACSDLMLFRGRTSIKIEGSFRAHQVPIMMDKPEHLQMLKDWLLSYHPEAVSYTHLDVYKRQAADGRIFEQLCE